MQYQPGPNGRRAIAAHDADNRLFLLIEPVEGAEGEPEAYLLEPMQIGEAMRIADDYNETGNLLIRSGPALTGQAIPQLFPLPASGPAD